MCGHYYIERSRMYSPKPADHEDRVDERSLYCGCMDPSFL